MSGGPSVPALVHLLSESLLPKAPSSSREQQRRTRTLSQLAYSTLLGLNQVNACVAVPTCINDDRQASRW